MNDLIKDLVEEYQRESLIGAIVPGMKANYNLMYKAPQHLGLAIRKRVIDKDKPGASAELQKAGKASTAGAVNTGKMLAGWAT